MRKLKMFKLSITLLYNQWIKIMTTKTLKYYELNNHENVWDLTKDLLRGKDTEKTKD